MAGHVVNVFILQEFERLNQRYNLRLRRRNLRDASNPFELPNVDFIRNFRLSKDCALYLIDNLVPHMRVSIRSTSIPQHLRILATLHFYGHGTYQHGVGCSHLLGISQPSVSRCIFEITRLINLNLLAEWIQFPNNQEAYNEIKYEFLQKYNVNGIIGAVDCSHVAIIAPPADDPNYPGRVYYNRKGYTSINTQIICDSNLYILNINPRFPGSTHDSAIWATSVIRRHLQQEYINNVQNTFLFGDSGYPLEPWLMTPVDGAAQGTPEYRYNEIHSRIRNCIERLNGVLKSRFRVEMPIDDEPDELHEDDLPHVLDGNAAGIQNPVGQWYAEGLRIRTNLIRIINEN